MNLRRSIITAGMAVALVIPAVANAMEVDGAGATGATRHVNAVASKHGAKTERVVGSFAKFPGFNIVVQASLGVSNPR